MPTAWSSSGSFTSDRIRPHPPKQQQQQPKGKSKGKTLTPEPPKSRAVRALEARLEDARTSNGHAKDPKGGCFCQARTHALSKCVTLCRRCGLILCTLNPPYCACPHCGSALADEHERGVWIETLQGELAEQLAKEDAARQRAVEEARAAEGAFPTLSGQPQMQTSRTPPLPTTRTVLSLNSDTKKVTVSSYTTPMQSRPASRGEDREEEEGRVLRPPEEVGYVKERLDPERPWKNARIGNVLYSPLHEEATQDTGRRTRRTKGRGKIIDKGAGDC